MLSNNCKKLTVEGIILEFDGDVGLLRFDVPNDDFAVIIDGNEVRTEGKEKMHFRVVVTRQDFVHLTTAL